MDVVRADFDRIAALEHSEWKFSDHFIAIILRQLPLRIHSALEVGCGTGTLAQQLARRSERVLALDLSPESIRIARERAVGQPNLTFEAADAQAFAYPTAQFDAIVSNAALHLMPLEPMLARLKDALAPGGVLVIVDRHHSTGPLDLLLAAVSFPALRLVRLRYTGTLRRRSTVRAAYGQRHYPVPQRSFADTQRAASILPGARVRRLLFSRYLLVWKKPG